MGASMNNRPETVICFQCGGSQAEAGAELPDCRACRSRLLDEVPAPFLNQAPIYHGDFGRHVERVGLPAAVVNTGPDFDEPEPA